MIGAARVSTITFTTRRERPVLPAKALEPGPEPHRLEGRRHETKGDDDDDEEVEELATRLLSLELPPLLAILL